MSTITDCARMYMEFLDKRYIFTLENNIEFTVYFTTDNFYHLLGLEKLIDIVQLKNSSPGKIYKDIISETISQKTIQKSKYYNRIAKRIEYFNTINDLLDISKSNKVIVDFDKSILTFKTKLKNTKYILYRDNADNYSHLTLGRYNDRLYPETFIVAQDKSYISGQTLLDIINIEIVELSSIKKSNNKTNKRQN